MALGPPSGSFVEVDGYVKLAGNALAEGLGQSHTVVHGGGAQRHEWYDIGSPHAGVFATVLLHVYQVPRLSSGPKSGLENSGGFAHHGNYHAVVVGIGLVVK